MRIDSELYQIAAAKYGLQLKDPIFAAFDKLIKDPKFELSSNVIENDYELYDEIMKDFYTDNKTTKTLKNILLLITTLNGRKGFYAKHMNGHGEYDKYNVGFYINMLGLELCNSSSGSEENGIAERGDGVVNGSKIRSAIYYLLDILNYKDSVTNDQPVITLSSPCCIVGRDIDTVEIYGTKEGFGIMMTLEEFPTLDHPGKSISGYGFDLVLTDIFTGEVIKKPIIFGNKKLYEGESALCGYEMYTPIPVPFSCYRVTIETDDYVSTDVTLKYIPIKEKFIPSEDDFAYELYLQNTSARTLFYKGDSAKVMIPETFENVSTRSIGAFTFTGLNVTNVAIPDGVTEIE